MNERDDKVISNTLYKAQMIYDYMSWKVIAQHALHELHKFHGGF